MYIRCAWAGGTTEFSRTIDLICWSCFLFCVLCHIVPICCFSVVLKYICTYTHVEYTFVDYFINNNFLNIFCIRLIIMQKYNSKSYLWRNIIITNPIFHFSVELKFAKHVNARTQSVFLLLLLSVVV